MRSRVRQLGEYVSQFRRARDMRAVPARKLDGINAELTSHSLPPIVWAKGACRVAGKCHNLP